MDDTTCLVCLTDLATVPAADASAIDASASTSTSTAATANPPPNGPLTRAKAAEDEDPERIATLLPCGHYLHNLCLKPWVQRANSCPKCRTNFNMVELRDHLGGPVVDSYSVQDKIQLAEAEEYIPEEEYSHDPDGPCIICESFNNPSELLLCDGCSNCCHYHCAGFDNVPSGTWFCESCQHEGHTRPRHAPPPVPRRRATGGRAARARDEEWAMIWNAVRHGANLDLEFPNTEPEEAAREREHQAEFRVWQDHFTQAAPLPRRVEEPRPDPDPESQEELRAWNAFDKAEQLQAVAADGSDNGNTVNNSRKRARTATPTEVSSPGPVRERKRPRQRRQLEPVTDQNNESGSTSDASRASRTVPIIAPRPVRNSARADDGKSFLTNLIKECQAMPRSKGHSALTEGHNVPRASSASGPNSPASSTPSSPRSMSPPLARSRPHSPGLTSQCDPDSSYLNNFAPISPYATMTPPVFSAVSSPAMPKHASPRTAPSEQNKKKKSETSTLTLSEKQALNKLVKEHLKPFYRSGDLTEDQFAEINRDISRKLYDLVQKAGGLNGDSEKWAPIAASEADSALSALKSSSDTS